MELKTEAWLIDNYKGGFGEHEKHEFSVVLSPLTDETWIDEGDEAHALCRVETAQGIIDGLSAALTAEARQHDETRKRLEALALSASEARRLLGEARKLLEFVNYRADTPALVEIDSFLSQGQKS